MTVDRSIVTFWRPQRIWAVGVIHGDTDRLAVLQVSNRAAADLARMLDRGAAGVVALTTWTGTLRDAMRFAPGHEALMNALKRAAISRSGGALFVNSGIDVSLELSRQTDSFWWAGQSFPLIQDSYADFCRVVRGYDPDHDGLAETDSTLTIDGGCGFGGTLVAFCLTPDA